MKRTLLIIVLSVIFIALPILTVAAETVFDSKEYLHGEAGVIGPLEREARISQTVTIPMVVFDGNYWYRFEEQKDTNLSGPLPDFAKDYMMGEGGLVNPIERTMEK